MNGQHVNRLNPSLLIPTPLKAQGSSRKRGQKHCSNQRLWMTTGEVSPAHRTVAYTNSQHCDSVHETWRQKSVRIYWRLIVANREEPGFSNGVATARTTRPACTMQQIPGHPGLVSETMLNKQTNKRDKTNSYNNKQANKNNKKIKERKNKHIGSPDYTQHVYNQKTRVGMEWWGWCGRHCGYKE